MSEVRSNIYDEVKKQKELLGQTQRKLEVKRFGEKKSGGCKQFGITAMTIERLLGGFRYVTPVTWCGPASVYSQPGDKKKSASFMPNIPFKY